MSNNSAWAVRIPDNAAAALGRLRLLKGIEVAQGINEWWLRGSALTDELELLLRTLPDGELFLVLDDGQLVPIDRRVPDGELPQVRWRPIRDAVAPSLPASGFAGRLTDKIPIQLVRSFEERPVNVMVVSFSEFKAWAKNAPVIRLQRLRFATRHDGKTIIHGEPIPPLNGKRFTEQSGIAVPLGISWSPFLEADQLATRWQLNQGDICLWTAEGRELVTADQFVACQRSSILETTRSQAEAL